MARIPLRPLIEYAFRTKNNGLDLEHWVLAKRKQGEPWTKISSDLTKRTDGLSMVSDQTVRLWFLEQDQELERSA